MLEHTLWADLRRPEQDERCRVAVSHVPGSGDVAEVTALWQHTDPVSSTTRAVVRTVLLVDAHARLGSIVTGAVGECEAGEQNEAGCSLLGLRVAGALVLPMVFRGGGPTWTCNRGREWT